MLLKKRYLRERFKITEVEVEFLGGFVERIVGAGVLETAVQHGDIKGGFRSVGIVSERTIEGGRTLEFMHRIDEHFVGLLGRQLLGKPKAQVGGEREHRGGFGNQMQLM